MEAFYTLQGEGFYQGQAAYFIRLGGCDVGCFWCDVKESWAASAHPQVAIEEIVAGAAAYPGRIAVITGGEPLLHNLEYTPCPLPFPLDKRTVKAGKFLFSLPSP